MQTTVSASGSPNRFARHLPIAWQSSGVVLTSVTRSLWAWITWFLNLSGMVWPGPNAIMSMAPGAITWGQSDAARRCHPIRTGGKGSAHDLIGQFRQRQVRDGVYEPLTGEPLKRRATGPVGVEHQRLHPQNPQMALHSLHAGCGNPIHAERDSPLAVLDGHGPV